MQSLAVPEEIHGQPVSHYELHTGHAYSKIAQKRVLAINILFLRPEFPIKTSKRNFSSSAIN